MRRGHRDDPETGDFPGERVFASKLDVRYVLDGADRPSDTLAVVFASAPKPGEPAHYRWHQLLREVACYRLFLLDDHGPRDPMERPSWYLGRGRRLSVPEVVCDLIDRIADELDVQRARVVTVGSSMGGWAALYYGARSRAGRTIAAEPQTRLGDYLCGPAFHTIAEHIAGGSSSADRDFLNGILFDALRARGSSPRVHLLCGRASPYYERHVLPLVDVLEERHIEWELELADYSRHGDLTAHFPAFLLERLGEALAEDRAPGCSGRSVQHMRDPA